jgi:multisubunit Na+/H+ antiporter MnhE subunit
MKKLFNILPEFYLIAMGLFWIIQRYIETGRMSYITLWVTWLLFVQVFYKNRFCGIVYSIILGAISVYKLYQGINTLIAVEGIAYEAIKYISVFSITLVAASAMLYRYATTKEKYGESVLTMTY